LASKALLLLQGPDVVVGTDVDGLYSRWLSIVLEVKKKYKFPLMSIKNKKTGTREWINHFILT